MAELVTNIQGYSIHDGPGIRTVVFLKGCSLACRWCSNPECISPKPEPGLVGKLCTKCGACDGVCPEGALRREDGGVPVIDRARCTGCGECAVACTCGALVLYGKPMEVDEVFDAVRRDKMFYDASGGGVTVSGGEALLKPAFVTALFERCRRDGIPTCVETSGNAPEAALRQVLPHADLLLFDLKLMDPARHAGWTGSPNDRILANARVAAAGGASLLFRMPLVPGVNDDEGSLRAVRAIVDGIDPTLAVEPVPFNPLAAAKYDRLGRHWPYADRRRQTDEALARARDILAATR